MKLEVDSLNLRFGEHVVLSDVYASFEMGQITGLLGRNGAGKSCLFNIIIGSLKAEFAHVRIDGKYHKKLLESKILKYLPQTYIFPDNMKIKRAIDFFEADIEVTMGYLENCKITLEDRFSHLSGGQRRLAEIYIYLNSQSPFVILDEPYTYLSPLEIDALKLNLNKFKGNKGIVVSDHQYQHIIYVSDKLYLIKSGKTHLLKSENIISQLQDLLYIL
jgi:ABC-type multidrug transport system ATPase subunit